MEFTPACLGIVSVANQPRKSMKWLDEPRNQLPLLFSTIMQNKNFKSCCAIYVLLAQNSKFQKKQTNHPKPTRAFNCNCSNYCWLLILKNKWGNVRIIDFTWLYPFSWMFSLRLYFLSGCHILIENSAIFITKMQWILWKKFDCNFWKKPGKNFQNNKNATLPLYLFCLTQKFSKVYFRLSFSNHLSIYWN